MRNLECMGVDEEESKKIPNDTHVPDKDLLFYYEHLFPFSDLFKWLSYRNHPNLPETETNDPLFFAKREVCLTCRKSSSSSSSPSAPDEFFLRWQSFRTVDQMVERLKDFSSLVAFKFDIGAVYSLPVSEKDTFQTAFKPEQKELVFDIDMNDYDDIRTCCKDKQVCQKCWRFLDIAMRLLDGALREDFGYEHLLWIFSGRRGVHCWVCDSTARLLPSDGRASVCEYLNLCTGTSQQMKKINLRGKVQPYSVDRAFTLAYRQFYSLLVEQDFFSSSSPPSSSSIESQSIPHYRAVLNYLPDNSHEGNSDSSHQHSYSNRGRYSNISRGEGKGGGAHFSSTVSSSCRDHMCKWIEKRKREGGFSSLEFFNEICMLSGSILPKAFAERSDCEGFRAGEEETKNFPSYLKEIVLAYSYPRLDINVSRDIGHLLKSPFCIHHATGRVCVPLDISSSSPLPYKEGRIPQDEEEEEERKKKKKKKLFDPAGVPTLSVLRREFDDPSRAHLPPHLRTSLAPYLEFFRDKFLHKLLKSVAQEMKYVKKLVGNVDARVKPESCF